MRISGKRSMFNIVIRVSIFTHQRDYCMAILKKIICSQEEICTHFLLKYKKLKKEKKLFVIHF